MRVSVTAEDIALGCPNSCRRCPVALALNRTLGGSWHVDGLGAECPAGLWQPLPQEVAAFVSAFDAGEVVSPFAFEAGWLGEEAPGADDAGAAGRAQAAR